MRQDSIPKSRGLPKCPSLSLLLSAVTPLPRGGCISVALSIQHLKRLWGPFMAIIWNGTWHHSSLSPKHSWAPPGWAPSAHPALSTITARATREAGCTLDLPIPLHSVWTRGEFLHPDHLLILYHQGATPGSHQK